MQTNGQRSGGRNRNGQSTQRGYNRSRANRIGRSPVRSAAAQARERVSDAVGDLQEKLDPSALQEELSATTASLVKKAQEFSRDNPLLVGAAGVVIGLAIGMAMPLTTGEGRVIGKLRDGLRGNARVLAENAIDKVQGAVQGAVRRIADPSAPKSDSQV